MCTCESTGIRKNCVFVCMCVCMCLLVSNWQFIVFCLRFIRKFFLVLACWVDIGDAVHILFLELSSTLHPHHRSISRGDRHASILALGSRRSTELPAHPWGHWKPSCQCWCYTPTMPVVADSLVLANSMFVGLLEIDRTNARFRAGR